MDVGTGVAFYIGSYPGLHSYAGHDVAIGTAQAPAYIRLPACQRVTLVAWSKQQKELIFPQVK